MLLAHYQVAFLKKLIGPRHVWWAIAKESKVVHPAYASRYPILRIGLLFLAQIRECLRVQQLLLLCLLLIQALCRALLGLPSTHHHHWVGPAMVHICCLLVQLPSIRWCIIARIGGNAASILLQEQLGLFGELCVIENHLRRNVPCAIIQGGRCCIEIDSRNLVGRLRGLGALR